MHHKKSFLDTLKDTYVHKYKTFFGALMLVALASLIFIVMTYATTGDFTLRDVSLKGGVSITINKAYADHAGLEDYLKSTYPKSSVSLRTIESSGKNTGLIVEASDITSEQLLSSIEQKTGKLGKEDYSTETMGSSLGESFFKETFVALLFAFLLMGLVFHFYFRNIYATFAALLSAFLDILITLAVMNILQVRLTAGGIAAYLMLIGYSIDTSILLSTKLLKEKPDDKLSALFSAMQTGLTMSAAGIAATGISYLFTNNITLKQIMLILIVGLVVDIFTTWIGNVSMLRMHLEKKEVRR